MSINEMTMELLVKENEALKRINLGLANLLISQIEDNKPTTLTWLTKDDLIEYSDINQAGGINAIKADAIEEATHKTRESMQDGCPKWLCRVSELEDYANKLRGDDDVS